MFFLLFSKPEGTGGGANIDGRNISLEVSNYPLKKASFPLGVIWHETIHLIFQVRYFHPLLRKYFLDDRAKFALINEIVTASLFPNGILGIRLLNNKPTRGCFYGIDDNSIKKILDLTKEYLDEKKHFDKEYIKKTECLVFKSPKNKGAAN